MKTKCGKTYYFMQKTSETGTKVGLIPVCCKSWSCPICRPKKAEQVRAFIRKNFMGKDVWMLTFTFYHIGTALNAWRGIGKKLNRMLSYARKYTGDFNYVRIVEPHKDGSWPHVHMLVDTNLCTGNFVSLVTDWGFGWNFHSRRMDGLKASNYMAKYLTKEWPVGDADLLRQIARTRIVSASRSLGPIFKSTNGWTVIKLSNPWRGVPQLLNATVVELRKNGATSIGLDLISEGFLLSSDGILSPEFIEAITGPLDDLFFAKAISERMGLIREAGSPF